MKKFLAFLILAVLVFPIVSFGYYDLGVNYSLKENYLNNDNLGKSSTLSNTLILWDKGQPIIYTGYSTSKNSEKNKQNFSLIQNRFDFGASLALAKNLKFKFAGTDLAEENSDNFSAYGMYLVWRPGKFLKKAELALEADTNEKTLYFVYGRLNIFNNVAFNYDYLLGYSSENDSSAVSKRLGFGAVPGIYDYLATLALIQNLFDGGQTKIYGLAKKDNFVAVYRNKPESDYLLALFTLSGHSLSQRANDEIFDAMFSSSLSGTRVVSNRNFDKIGMSPAYQIQDYGKIVLSVSVSKIDISEATLLNDAEEIDWTLGDVWKIKSFYLSGGRIGETNIFYNTSKMALEGDYETYLSIGFGGKISIYNIPARFGITNFYNLNQSNWSGISANLIFSF